MSSAEERLGLPYVVQKTRQEEGRVYEKKQAKRDGARPHPGSGAGRIKDDASNDNEVFEYKNVMKSHTLIGTKLLGLFKRAIQQDKDARYVVFFENVNLTATITLRKGK